MASQERVHRVGDAIQRVLAQVLMREIEDPRLKMATVSAVEVTRDLAHAKVFISLMGGDNDAAEKALQALKKAGGFLRRRLAKEIEMRSVPELHFVHDASSIYGNDISAKIDEAIRKDQGE